MNFKNKVITGFALLLCLSCVSHADALEATIKKNKYPDYAYEYLGKDKFENFNRKMFYFNGGLNKLLFRPVHIVWTSIMPQYGIDRIMNATNNIEYPIRLVSTLVQRDFKASGTETVRFLTNTTIGLGGLYDPAKKIFKIEPVQEDMEQALAKCKIKRGPYLVLPVIMSTSPRAIAGKVLDAGLNPSSYIASPVLAAVKAGILVNRTSYMQPLSKMLESTYADPYDIVKKLYGLESHIKLSNLDRSSVLYKKIEDTDELDDFDDLENIIDVKSTLIEGSAKTDNIILKDGKGLKADLLLPNYNPQAPVTDSMRTAFFELPGINSSIWNEMSIWNRCFAKKIKTSSVNIDPSKDNYKFRYILQKDKNSPLAIIYPSIGEGINSHHAVVLAKIFYDKGYSVLIQGSHFQWEFVKSMPDTYRPGIPANDARQLRIVTSKIIDSLQAKYDCNFKEKVLLGTSFGALTALFLANEESKENLLNIKKYISINPPIELIFAMRQVDKNSEEWSQKYENLKECAAKTAAKVIDVSDKKNDKDFKIGEIPFSEDEAKLITGFIMHQKLSDLIFTLENTCASKRCDIYNNIDNMNYQDYAEKYLLSDDVKTIDNLAFEASLYSIEKYLKNNNNYKIYHTLDDYLINKKQLEHIKKCTGDKTVIVSNGGHLGFMYRKEFMDSLNRDIEY